MRPNTAAIVAIGSLLSRFMADPLLLLWTRLLRSCFLISGHLPGRAACRLPELCGGPMPIESEIARAVLLQMFEACDCFFDVRPMAGRYPPQRHGRSFEMLEPVGAAAI